LAISRHRHKAPPIKDKNSMETQIKAALTALLAAIKAGEGQGVAEEMARLDGFLEQGRLTLHPQLVHFLAQRSYAKALMFLGGETDIPVGVCGGGRTGKSAGA